MEVRQWCVTGLVACVVAASAHADPVVPASSNPSQAEARAKTERQIRELKAELRAAEQRDAQQTATLRALIAKLQQLDAQVNPGAPAPAPSEAANSASDKGSDKLRQPAQTATDKAVYQEQGALFSRHLTLEPKLTYTYYDRNQINLNGFLALSSIFLGNISVQKVKATTVQFDMLAREGVTPRLQLALDLPFLYRSFEFISGGAGGSASTLTQATVNTRPFVQGDVNVGAYYQLAQEDANHPNVVWNLQVIAPTGVNPYGIKVVQANPNNTNLLVPTALPTGNGLWGAQTGLSFVKTSDPGILFGSFGVLHYFPHHFKDISNTVGTITPGTVALGDVYQYGVGMAFALNRRMSISTSYSQSIAGRAKTRADGADWQPVVGSDANAASFNFGVTYGLNPRETLVTNLGIGLTQDAPNVMLSVSVPYSF